MLLAIPIEGSHYLVDVIAGVVLAMATWIIAGRAILVIGQKTPQLRLAEA